MSFARSCWNCLSGSPGYVYTKVTSAGSCIKNAYQSCHVPSCISIPASYAKTALKYTFCAANVVAVPLCFSGRTYFSAASFLNYLSSAMTSDNPATIAIAGTFAVGSLIFAAASRSKPIYLWYFPDNTKAAEQKLLPTPEAAHPIPSTQPMRLEAPNELALPLEQKTEAQLSWSRWTAGWSVRLLCDGVSVMQMLSTDMTTYLGLQKILSLFFSEEAVGYIGLVALGFFDVNYYAFNLTAAFANSQMFQKAINTKTYNYSNRSFGIMILCVAPTLFSIPTGGYYSAKQAIPVIPFLQELGEDHVTRLSYTAAAVNLLSCAPMTMPSIYNAVETGIKFHVPPDHTPWVGKLTCDATQNKWRLLRNGIMLPFGIMDNIGSGAFAASGFAYTVAEVPFMQWDPHSGGTIAMIIFVGASSTISTLAFVTLRSYSGIIDEYLKQNTNAVATVFLGAPPGVTFDATFAQPLEGVVLEQPRDRRGEVAAAQQPSDEKSRLLDGVAAQATSDAPAVYGAVVSVSAHRNSTWNERRTLPPSPSLAAAAAAKQIASPPSPH